MAASDYASIFFKNRLHLVGRPQMSTCPNPRDAIVQGGGKRRAGISSNLSALSDRFGSMQASWTEEPTIEAAIMTL
jgi:hypothetical protein